MAGNFSLRNLYVALDERRRERSLSWSEVALEVNRHRTFLRPIAVSTIKGLETKPDGEGDGILQMLLWLDRTPESFLVDVVPDGDDSRFRLPRLTRGQILRWDTKALHAALDTERKARGLTWASVAFEIRGVTP